MLKPNTCYVYKEYCDKYEDTDVYTREFFDAELFTQDMPDEAMQWPTMLCVADHALSHWMHSMEHSSALALTHHPPLVVW